MIGREMNQRGSEERVTGQMEGQVCLLGDPAEPPPRAALDRARSRRSAPASSNLPGSLFEHARLTVLDPVARGQHGVACHDRLRNRPPRRFHVERPA